MLRRFVFAALERSVNRAYRSRLALRGTEPEGVFWRNKSSQIARFDALLSMLKQLSPTARPTVCDVGCGYGAMFDFISNTQRYQTVAYRGVDINRAMVAACKDTFPDHKSLFSVGTHPNSMVDFCVFSGTFNLCHTQDTDLWNEYIFRNLERCWQRSRYGLILNLLCAPASHIKNQIFYAHRPSFIARAQNAFGPTHATTTPHVMDDVTFTILRP